MNKRDLLLVLVVAGVGAAFWSRRAPEPIASATPGPVITATVVPVVITSTPEPVVVGTPMTPLAKPKPKPRKPVKRKPVAKPTPHDSGYYYPQTPHPQGEGGDSLMTY